jgi:energy-coupling factor transporter ATP-binding protein EcfA2
MPTENFVAILHAGRFDVESLSLLECVIKLRSDLVIYISCFQVGNFKSFYQPPPLKFTQGFNIISGQNNSGKTALLKALSLDFFGKPHRSLRTLPTRNMAPDQTSWIDVSFTLPTAEVKELFLAFGGGRLFSVVRPAPTSQSSQNIGHSDYSNESAQRLVDFIFSEQDLTFKIRFDAGANTPTRPRLLEVPSYGLYEPQRTESNQFPYAQFHVQKDGTLHAVSASGFAGLSDFGLELVPFFRQRVYRFEAERMNLGSGAHGGNILLAPNAGNLPEVLNQLQHNRARFRDPNSQLNKILPQVKEMSVRATGPGQVEIVVWCHDPESQREDLAVPSSESGTGIGQVLAILYVVMTSDRPQVIIIDEPQSFLHPGAARKLMEFLKLSPHQFIIATHSATIIATANPETITLARFEKGETTLEQLDAKLEKGIRSIMAELGIRLSDVFGADNILWVEGRTEEECFPIIVETILRRRMMGTVILGVKQTGDLEGRDPKRVFKSIEVSQRVQACYLQP